MATTATEQGAVTVREVALHDAAAVAELSGQLSHSTSTAEMERRLRQVLPLCKGHTILVVCRGAEVAGWIQAEVVRHIHKPSYVMITGLVVKDGARSLGLGSRLCAEAENWARQQGVDVIRVTSRMTRERAHRFYLREGYTQTKISAVFEKALF
ncbi:MAG: GNAT family N-acetyltransferase [Acidobacteria bacterium]|nr:GNAT family N-acetyltransferase [Acidobacteriota bacterium]